MPGAVENCARGKLPPGQAAGYAGDMPPCMPPAPPARPPASVWMPRQQRHRAACRGAVGKVSRLCRAHRGAAGAIWAWEGTRRAWEGWQAARRDSIPPAPLCWDGLLRGQLCGASSTSRALAGEGAQETLGACRALRAGKQPVCCAVVPPMQGGRMPRATCGETDSMLRGGATHAGQSHAARSRGKAASALRVGANHAWRSHAAFARESGQCAAR